MAKTFRYQHLRTTTPGSKPSTSTIREGEIAVNLAASEEKIFLKNSSNVVIDFIPESQIDAKIASQSGTTDGKVQALSGAIDTVSGNVNTLSSATDTKISNLSGAVDTKVANDIKDFFDGAKYEMSGATHVINFYHGGTIKATINAEDFIKDGMVDTVEIKTVDGVTCLVITFNTDSGKQPINIPISNIFDATNYYLKTEVDTLLAAKANTATTYTKTEVDTALAAKANTATTYTKTEVDTALANKTDTATTSALNNVVTAHTANTDVHVTTANKSTWDAKQEALVSGTNIKTVVTKGLLGSGNVEISLTDLSTSNVKDLTVDGNFIILDAGTF